MASTAPTIPATSTTSSSADDGLHWLRNIRNPGDFTSYGDSSVGTIWFEYIAAFTWGLSLYDTRELAIMGELEFVRAPVYRQRVPEAIQHVTDYRLALITARLTRSSK